MSEGKFAAAVARVRDCRILKKLKFRGRIADLFGVRAPGKYVTQEQFLNFMWVFHPHAPENAKIHFFARMLDLDRDELISKADIFQFFVKSQAEEPTGLGKKMAFVEEEFDGIDSDGDGLIPIDEFAARVSQTGRQTMLQLMTVEFKH